MLVERLLLASCLLNGCANLCLLAQRLTTDRQLNLFRSRDGGRTFDLSPTSGLFNPEHLRQLRAAGRALGIALLQVWEHSSAEERCGPRIATLSCYGPLTIALLQRGCMRSAVLTTPLLKQMLGWGPSGKDPCCELLK